MATPKIEHRLYKVELRAGADSPEISGYAAVFNSPTDIGPFREEIAPGAFKRAIAEKQDVRCLMNHDANHVLGRTKNGTLTLVEDNTGLKFVNTPPDTTLGKDCRTLVMRGDIDQCSFAFIVKDETVTYGDDGSMLRRVNDVDLFDVSIVTYPAYDNTSCEARSLQTKIEEITAAKPKVEPVPEVKPEPVAETHSKEWGLTQLARMDDDGDKSDYLVTGMGDDDGDDDSDPEECSCRCGMRGCASLRDED